LENFGLLGLLPFVLAIFFLLWQRDVIFPIIGSLIIGSILLSRFNPLLGFFHTAGGIIGTALSESSSILVIITIGEVILFFSLLNRSGFIHTFTKKLANNNFTKTILEAVILASGIIVCIDRYLAVMLVGAFSRPFSERKKLSPMKHAYILNTATSAVSILIPFTTLTPLIITVIGAAFEGLGLEYSPGMAFYKSLPYQFSTIFALFTVITSIVLKKDIFLMKEGCYKDSAPLIHFGIETEKGKKPSDRLAIYGVSAALLIVFGAILLSLLFENRLPTANTIENVRNLQLVFVNALFSGLMFVIIFLLLTKSITYDRLKPDRAVIPATPLITFLYILLALSVHTMAKKIGFQTSIAALFLKGSLPAVLVPLIVFLLSSAFSFLSGSSVLTILAMMPLALKMLGLNLPDPHIVGNLTYATIASVLSGACFGDTNSPLSLNFIISSAITKSSVNGHFNTQIIYSLIAAGTAILFGYIPLMAGARPYLSISAGFLAITGIFIFIDRKDRR